MAPTSCCFPASLIHVQLSWYCCLTESGTEAQTYKHTNEDSFSKPMCRSREGFSKARDFIRGGGGGGGGGGGIGKMIVSPPKGMTD